MYIPYRINKNFEPDVNFEGLEIPSEFTIADAHWTNAKTARTLSLSHTPTKLAKFDSVKPKLKPRKLTFSDEVTVHQYEVISNCSSDSDSILCPESPEEKCPDEKSDYLFNTDTESESETESVEFLGGKRAKKSLKVKFGKMP